VNSLSPFTRTPDFSKSDIVAFNCAKRIPVHGYGFACKPGVVGSISSTSCKNISGGKHFSENSSPLSSSGTVSKNYNNFGLSFSGIFA